jgi:hypothetical protein
MVARSSRLGVGDGEIVEKHRLSRLGGSEGFIRRFGGAPGFGIRRVSVLGICYLNLSPRPARVTKHGGHSLSPTLVLSSLSHPRQNPTALRSSNKPSLSGLSHRAVVPVDRHRQRAACSEPSPLPLATPTRSRCTVPV